MTPKNKPAKPAADPRESQDSVDLVNRPGPGETPETAEHPEAPLDAEGQAGGRDLGDEIFIPAADDDAGGLPHQQEANIGTSSRLPPCPDDEPRSLPDKPPTL